MLFQIKDLATNDMHTPVGSWQKFFVLASFTALLLDLSAELLISKGNLNRPLEGVAENKPDMSEFYFFCYDYCPACDISMKSFAHNHIYSINFKKS